MVKLGGVKFIFEKVKYEISVGNSDVKIYVN